MKVTLINTSDTGGGAPVACLRLLKALDEQKIDAQLLVQEKKTSENRVHSVVKNFSSRLKARFDFFYERLPFIFLYEKDKSVRFAFSTANAGVSIKNEPLVKQADIIHLHWTNSGFLSIDDLKELIDTGKPIVWTLHDMWTFTGGCHYAGTCDHFTGECGDCYFLSDPGENDISRKGWLHKAAMYAGAENVTFVTCSQWLGTVAKRSSLISKFRIESIPNPIDVNLFSPTDKTTAKERWRINPFAKVIAFGAANINDRRKGITYLVDALTDLYSLCPDAGLIEIVIFGKNKHFDASQLPFRVYELGPISVQEELVEIYNLADVFVMPSVEDNLPNTVMEALACGTPVVAFNTGGVPEMIDHQQNGYLAEYKSAGDLAKGLYEILHSDKTEELFLNARNKVLNTFTNKAVAQQYHKLYKSILK